MSEYVVIYEQADDGGWGAYLPDLPGVVALGATCEEAAERIQEALYRDTCNASSSVIGDDAVTAVLVLQDATLGSTLGAIRSSA